jgi:hypothetical protein
MAACGGLMASCGGSSGRLANPQRVITGMVKDRDVLLVQTNAGHEHLRVDGTDWRMLWPDKYFIRDLSANASVVVLGDSDTNLYVADGLGATPRRVSELDDRTGDAALSPDAATVAVTRHADFSTPQSSWGKTEDDTVYLVDVKTAKVRDVIAKSRDELVTSLAWYPDGTALFLGMFHFDKVMLDLATRRRAKTEELPYGESTRPQREKRVCEKTGAVLVPHDGRSSDNGIDLVEKGGAVKPLIVVEGRSRGFHDHQPTIDEYMFTSSCGYVVFTYQRAVWIVDVATSEVAKLIDGWDPRLL